MFKFDRQIRTGKDCGIHRAVLAFANRKSVLQSIVLFAIKLMG
ncbi:hypothetical protein X749_31530 [Mesorhizobium sp. LNJC391B00]|nr:hypothetical protein X749_31530 [Mesorhizobium sp. LNJC391B00]